MDAMALFLEEPDRALRQEAWERIAARRLQDVDKVEEIFERLLDLRTRIARNAGFEDYRDYAFRRLGRFDYSAADCLEFHASIERTVVPALKHLQARRSEQLGLFPLRPWDGAVDPLGRPPLRPFKNVAGLVAGSQRVFDQLDSGLGAGFQLMQDQRLLDLANREGKAPGGFQTALREARLPFIFMNAVGQQRDVETILHEAGHAFHTLAARERDLDAYRSAPIEFCEVASMSMELLGNEFIEEFYSPAEARRARRKHLEGIVRILTWVPVVDAFQHWVYTHPGHSRTERSAEWIRLLDRFGDVDWSGLEEQRAASWHRVLHLFVVPFYFVEYGIAQLGALQVWANSKRDKAGAMSDYKAALALGGSRPLPELFAAAGCRFRFDQATIAPLVEMLEAELRLLGHSQ
ncbi:MAG: hypothetical protein JWO82_2618 [Akkermansiaceae bacterium]|nr:hypothetical protein [Akkermansiaceae bacterium]